MMPVNKRYVVLAVLVLCCFQAQAQRAMKDFWMSMPDSLCEYLNANKRREMVDFYGMGVRAETYNLLEGMSVMDTLTTHHTVVTLSPASQLTVALLEKADGDSLLCVVSTFLGPQPESVLTFYDKEWHPVPVDDLVPQIQAADLMHRPDTMDVDEYDRLVRLIDPVMTSASFSPSDASLKFRLSTPLLSANDRQRVDAILVDRKYQWDGRAFRLQ
jgi:hypothetical protein